MIQLNNKQNIILLDIDDTILPTTLLSDNNVVGDTEDSLGVLTINCKRLVRICELCDVEIRIISSWSNGVISFDNGFLEYIRCNDYNKPYYKYEKKAFDIIFKYLNKYIIGISSGNKIRDINIAKDDNNVDKVIVLDDTDFSSECNIDDNIHYVKSEGYISNRMYYKIINILK